MANYTVELRKVVESGINIFNFQYDFYGDDKKRQEFEASFIRHFYFREIGCESVDRFRWYLEDKMKTVFPYYNELFKAAQIEYNILDNYNIREEYERTLEGVDKTNGVSSSVGRVMDDQHTEVNETRNGESSVTSTGNGSRTDKEIIDTDTTANQEDTTATESSMNGSKTDKETIDNETTLSRAETGTDTQTGFKDTTEETKFLDTPQGLLTLEGANYLTNLTRKESAENSKNDVYKEGTLNDTGTSDTERNLTSTDERSENSDQTHNMTGSGTTDTERDFTSETTQNDTTTGSDQSEGTSNANYQAEQKSTMDNNTRSERVTDRIEKSVFTKKGNIGIDTDSDMITKHINLQKVLKNIERMFFDECEDLFMLVY